MTHTVQDLTQIVTQCTLHREVSAEQISIRPLRHQEEVKEVEVTIKETTTVILKTIQGLESLHQVECTEDVQMNTTTVGHK